MRTALFAAATVIAMASACGGSSSSRASNQSAASMNAAAAVAAKPLTGARALAVMHQRHEGMEDIGRNNKVLRRELTGSAPNLAAVRTAAATIARHSSEASRWFPQGTGPNVGKTGAKPEIWQNPRDFAAKLHNFQVAAQALNAAARSGDIPSIKSRYADLGGTCKACHDTYRSEMHH